MAAVPIPGPTTVFRITYHEGSSYTSTWYNPVILPKKQTRVLKERRIIAGLKPRFSPAYAVFLQNTPIFSDAVPRAMPWAGMRCPFRANGTMTFSVSGLDIVPCTISSSCGLYQTNTTFPILRPCLTAVPIHGPSTVFRITCPCRENWQNSSGRTLTGPAGGGVDCFPAGAGGS